MRTEFWGKYRRWPRIRILVVALFAIALSGWLYLRAANDVSLRLGAFSEPAAVARAGPCEVLAVIDGDTLFVRQPAANAQSKEFAGKVRLLGVNTPETVKRDVAPQPWGREATEFLRRKVAAGNVRLELDKRRIDAYGRCLAYVYVGNEHLSESLVAAGLARVHTYPGDSTTINRQLLRAQDEAKRRQLGMWSP
jgi:micrococcal nuclease